MFKVVMAGDLSEVGSIGYREKDWRDEKVYETGWSILPEAQGRGIATEAARMVIDIAKAERRHRFIHAFPSVDNLASNAICRKLGFSLIESCEFEYPPGQTMLCNDWQFELFTNSY